MTKKRNEEYHKAETGRQEALQQKNVVIENNRLMALQIGQSTAKIEELKSLVGVCLVLLDMTIFFLTILHFFIFDDQVN